MSISATTPHREETLRRLKQKKKKLAGLACAIPHLGAFGARTHKAELFTTFSFFSRTSFSFFHRWALRLPGCARGHPVLCSGKTIRLIQSPRSRCEIWSPCVAKTEQEVPKCRGDIQHGELSDKSFHFHNCRGGRLLALASRKAHRTDAKKKKSGRASKRGWRQC